MTGCSRESSPRSSRTSRKPCSAGSNAEAWPWTLTAMSAACAALAAGCAIGCARTVLVSDGSPMRIGRATEARVYTRHDGEWVLSADKVEIPEGWYVVPPRFVEDER